MLRGLTGSADSQPTILDQMQQEKENKALVAWVNENYTKAKADRLRFERQWALNMAFFQGKQYMQYMPAAAGTATAGKLWTPPAPSWAVRSITNRIRPIIRTELARLTSNKPSASVVPASSEDADLFAAQAAEQVWEALYSGKKIHNKFVQSIFWTVICGTGFMKDWYDENAYDTVSKADGTIQYGVVTPYHIFIPDIMEPDIEEQQWVINAYTKPVSYVKQMFGLSVNPSVTEAKSPFDTAMLQTMAGKNDAKPDSTLVIECWIKPGTHELFPQGGLVTVVGEQVAQRVNEWPFAHKDYPFTKFDHIPTGMFYSESVITDLIGPQREYNRTKGQIIESKNRMSKPQLAAAKGSVDPRKITSEPGLVVEYKPGLGAPTPIPLQSLPSYVLQSLDREIADMEDISSQHQVSRGENPGGGVTAATAISFLQERDDSLMTTAYQSVESGWEKLARHTISHVVQFWDVPRTVSITGVDGSFDSIALQGTELATGTDIRIEAGSALPVSKAAKQAFLLDMMKMGFVDPSKGLELMDMGGIDKLYDELKVDERQAQRENMRMARLEIEQIMQHEQMAAMQADMAMQQDQINNGMMDPNTGGPADDVNGIDPRTGMADDVPQPGPIPNSDPNTGAPLQMPQNIIPVNTWDNHQLHIDVHNRYRKSQAFELLPEKIKQQFEAHVSMHAMALNTAAMQASMMPPGDPGMGAQDSGGAPLGSNQFGPPGTSEGMPPPDASGGGMPPGGM